MRFWSKQKFLDMGELFFFLVMHGILVGTNLWTWENFCQVRVLFCFFFLERVFWNDYFVNISMIGLHCFAEPQELRQTPDIERHMGILSLEIKNIIDETGFQTFFQALLNQDSHEYKDLQLLLSLLERFWDTTCTFYFPGIGEVILTPYYFSVITGLRLGSERIMVNGFLTSKEIYKVVIYNYVFCWL